MKHSAVQIALSSEVNRLGLNISDDRLHRLAEALEWLGPAAFRLGLTNYADLAEFTSNLVAPALCVLQPSVLEVLTAPFLDFGAGSGAVGLSLAILRPDIQVVLADRRARVVQFIDLAASRLRLVNVRTLQIDLSNPPPAAVATIGTVLIRAFGPTPVALEHATGLLRADGAIALWHQPPAPPPPADLLATGTFATNVPSLVLTVYRRGV